MVAMSGGVDSSVAALLLRDEGHDVTGVTMCLGVKSRRSGRTACCGREAVEDARKVCDSLGIRHYVLDFSRDLEQSVIAPFVAEYRRGRTPNPCIECNRHLKFGFLLKTALASGFDFLATGHYAAIERDRNGYRLLRPRDAEKDQTYFLYPIERAHLRHVLFPLAPYKKEDVRKIARDADLPVAAKEESQDICFVTQRNYREFLQERVQDIAPGPITDANGNVLGLHRGIAFYTLGQRRGLGIGHAHPLYVIGIDAAENRLVVGPKSELTSRGLVAGNLNILSEHVPARARVKIRHGREDSDCTLKVEAGRLTVLFSQPQAAVTPGQSAVCYEHDRVIVGGIIEEVIRENQALISQESDLRRAQEVCA